MMLACGRQSAATMPTCADDCRLGGERQSARIPRPGLNAFSYLGVGHEQLISAVSTPEQRLAGQVVRKGGNYPTLSNTACSASRLGT